MPTNMNHLDPRDREARRAALRSARADWTPAESLTVTAAEVRPGDRVERIPTQANVRGVRIGANVAEVAPDYTWVIGRHKVPVDAVLIRFHLAEAVSVPATFRVQIRRTVTP